MFEIGDQVWVNIPVNGATIAVPGICSGNEFTAPRVTRNGSTVPAQYVDVVTYHAIPAEAAKSTGGKPFSYYKEQRQAAFFMRHRAETVKELDDFESWDQLRQAVQKSSDTLAQRVAGTLPAAVVADNATRQKAKFAVGAGA